MFVTFCVNNVQCNNLSVTIILLQQYNDESVNDNNNNLILFEAQKYGISYLLTYISN